MALGAHALHHMCTLAARMQSSAPAFSSLAVLPAFADWHQQVVTFNAHAVQPHMQPAQLRNPPSLTCTSWLCMLQHALSVWLVLAPPPGLQDGLAEKIGSGEVRTRIRDAPFVQIPLGVTEDRLVGTVDIEASMKVGAGCRAGCAAGRRGWGSTGRWVGWLVLSTAS